MREIFALLLLSAVCGCAAPASPPVTTGRALSPSAIIPSQPPAPPMLVSPCVLEGNKLRKVEGNVDPITGDTLVNGRRFSVAYPSTSPPYAGGMPWYVDNNPQGDFIDLGGTSYVRFGVARVDAGINADPTILVRVGDLQGIPVFAERGDTSPAHIIYLPVRAGCAFQPYQRRPGQRPPLPAGRVYIEGGGPPPRPPLIATPVEPADTL